MVEDSQDHPKGHVGDPQDDGHLHLEGVEEAQVVDGQAPDLGKQKGRGGHEGAAPPESLSSARVCPSRAPCTIRHPPDEEQHSGMVKSTAWAPTPVLSGQATLGMYPQLPHL